MNEHDISNSTRIDQKDSIGLETGQRDADCIPSTSANSHFRQHLVNFQTPLPTFSDHVRQMMVEGKVEVIWSKVINQAADYYLNVNPNIGNSSEYQSIGGKMHREYPAIEHEGKNAWVINIFNTIYSITWVGMTISYIWKN